MAGRPRSIDREKVLDAADALIVKAGAGALSFDAVAKAAGVTKSGVQYCFGTKENLIRSIIRRWEDTFERDVRERVGENASARSTIRGHLEVTRDSDEAEYSRSAALMTAVLQRPDEVAQTRAWYMRRLSALNLDDEADRRAAVALLAGEGAFMLRALGLVELADERWGRLFAEILSLIGREPGDGRQRSADG